VSISVQLESLSADMKGHLDTCVRDRSEVHICRFKGCLGQFILWLLSRSWKPKKERSCRVCRVVDCEVIIADLEKTSLQI